MKKLLTILNKSKRKTIEYVITNRLFLSYLIMSIIGMIVVRHVTIGRVTSIYPFITDLGLILVVGAIGYFFKPKNQF